MSREIGICRVCGKEAKDKCSGCNLDALYCSVSCQRSDWKDKGHKQLCKGPPVNRKIHTVVRDLFSIEWRWLKGLSSTEKTEIFEERKLQAPLNHLFLAGEVALVLAGANACTLVNHFGFLPKYSSEYYAKVLAPWYGTHQEFLNQIGFFVEYLDYPVLVLDDSSGIVDIGNAAIIWDSNSPKSRLINGIFWGERHAIPVVPWREAMDCFYFKPTRNTDDGQNQFLVKYYFEFPKQVFGGDSNVCCSPCLEFKFLIDPVDANAVGQHFFLCYKALTKIGFLLEFVLNNQMERSDDVLAKAWWAACGKDKTTFEKWVVEEKGAIFFNEDLSRAKKNRVIDLVHGMVGW